METQKTTEKKKVESYLPIFNGFYNTVFEPNEDLVIEEPYTYDDYDFDYTQYKADVAENCVNCVQWKLKDLGFDIALNYQAINSPKYYNFSNDAIHVEYTFTEDCFTKIQDYLSGNVDNFSQYLIEHYTSCDGFISFHSNDYKEWLLDIKEEVTLEHKLGSILNFILLNEEYNEMELYQQVSENVYLQGQLKEKK
jgi:hypothetical protein